MAESLRADTTGLRSAGTDVGAAAEGATPGSDHVQPCAHDFVSVAASTRFSAQVALARTYTTMANSTARQYGVKLDTTASSYDEQEAASAAALGGPNAAAAGRIVSAGMTTPAAGLPGAPAALGGQALTSPAGEVPTTPRDIARLIETGRGGAGRRAWQGVEQSLRSEAKQLDDTAEQLGAAINRTQDSWQSPSAQAATARMRALQTWYQGHAGYVRGLAEQAETHVDNFHQATTAIPTYKQVVDGERELQTAQQANQRSKGALKPAVVHAQVKLGKLYQASTTGFTSYTFAEAAPVPKDPTPPPVAPADTPTATPAAGSGDGPVATPKRQPSPKGAPLDPVQQGPGVSETLTSSGPTWPPGATDPAPPGTPLVDTVADTAGTAVPQLVPGIIGGVVGGIGGVVGGLTGAGEKALQSLEQAAAPAMSGLGQHPAGGGQPHGGEQSPQSPEPQPPADMPAPGDLGGGGGLDTEPAGGAEPLSAPTPTAAAPAAAAPVSSPSAPIASETPAPAIGAMGPMMPPMMGPRTGSSGPDNKELYKERKLAVVAPPNSEPVKNRRESRRDKGDRKS